MRRIAQVAVGVVTVPVAGAVLGVVLLDAAWWMLLGRRAKQLNDDLNIFFADMQVMIDAAVEAQRLLDESEDLPQQEAA